MSRHRLLFIFALAILVGAAGWLLLSLSTRKVHEGVPMAELKGEILPPNGLILFYDVLQGAYDTGLPQAQGEIGSPLFPTPPLSELNNPLVNRNARLRLINESQESKQLFLLPPKPFDPEQKPQIGVISVDVRDSNGMPVQLGGSASTSFNRASAASHSAHKSQLQIMALQPGDSAEISFELWGTIAGTGVQPGVYTIRANIEYLAVPDAEVKVVTSQPLTIEITASHIAAWKKWLSSGGR